MRCCLVAHLTLGPCHFVHEEAPAEAARLALHLTSPGQCDSREWKAQANISKWGCIEVTALLAAAPTSCRTSSLRVR